MIKAFWLLFCITLPLFANTLIQKKVYHNDDSVDILLTFDAPFTGALTQQQEHPYKRILLDESHIETSDSLDIIAPYLQKVTLKQKEDKLQLTFISEKNITIKASKTVDNYELRLRISPQQDVLEKPISSQEGTLPIKTKEENNITTSYLKMLLVLALLIGFLYLFKKFFQNRGNTQESWLFGEKSKNQKITIKQQRAIDMKNRVALISYGDKEYLILLGNTNLHLDTFHHDSQAEKAFDTLLQENQDKLKEGV